MTSSTDPDFDVEFMSRCQAKAEIKKLRAAIRHHRDSSGHDLCWYVPELWQTLPDKIEPKPVVPGTCEFLYNCTRYRKSLRKPNMFFSSASKDVRKGLIIGCVVFFVITPLMAVAAAIAIFSTNTPLRLVLGGVCLAWFTFLVTVICRNR